MGAVGRDRDDQVIELHVTSLMVRLPTPALDFHSTVVSRRPSCPAGRWTVRVGDGMSGWAMACRMTAPVSSVRVGGVGWCHGHISTLPFIAPDMLKCGNVYAAPSGGYRRV